MYKHRLMLIEVLMGCVQMSVRDALNSAMDEEMARDDKVTAVVGCSVCV